MISLSLCAMASAGALPSWRPCQQEIVRIVNGCSTFGPFYHTSPESGHVKRFFRSGSILGRPGAKRHRRTASPNLPPAPKVNRKKCFLKICFLGAVRFVFTTLGQEKLVRSVVRVDTEDLPCQSRTTVASWAASPSGLSLDIRAQASSVDLATWCCPHGSTTRGYSGGGHHRRRRDDDRPASRVRVQPQPSRAADTLKKRISGSLT